MQNIPRRVKEFFNYPSLVLQYVPSEMLENKTKARAEAIFRCFMRKGFGDI